MINFRNMKKYRHLDRVYDKKDSFEKKEDYITKQRSKRAML